MDNHEWIMGRWVDSRKINLDLDKVRDIYIVTMPEDFGGAPIGAFWNETDANRYAAQFYKSGIMAVELKRWKEFHDEEPGPPLVYKRSIQPLAALLAQEDK